MSLVQVGAVAPEFSVKDNNDNPLQLSDFKGKRVLLSWHPVAWTPVCTDQMRAIENSWEKFQELNTIPLGFSVDPTPCKKVWAVALGLKNLRIPSDFWPHGKVARDYGIFMEAEGMSERANIIIDEYGVVQWVKVYPLSELPDINEVIEVLSNM